MLSDDWTL